MGMSPSYLMKKIVVNLEEILAGKKAELKTATKGLTEEAADKIMSVASHPADMSFSPDIKGGCLDRLKIEIIKLESAIERAKNGTYGICQCCGEPILLKRLKAMPWAERCTHCESEAEKHLARIGRRYLPNGRQHFALSAI